MHQLEMDFLSSLMNIAGIADNNFPLKRGVLQEDSKLASGSLQASFPTSTRLFRYSLPSEHGRLVYGSQTTRLPSLWISLYRFSL
jgi:hypothetical protein